MSLIIKYNSYLFKQDYSENTLNLYIYYLRKFMYWYQKEMKKPLGNSKLEKSTVTQYIQYLSSKYSTSSVNSYIKFIVSYNKFLINEGIQETMVATNDLIIKIPKKKVEKIKINERDVESLLMEVCSNDCIKNSTMLCLIAYAGLKSSEVVELELKHIDFDNRKIHISGKYTRDIAMNSVVENSLKLYLKDEEVIKDYLFTNERDMKYTSAGIHWILRKNRSNPNVTITTLRNFYMSKLKAQGYSEKEIDEILGYSIKKKDYTNKKIKEMLTVKQFAELVEAAPSTIVKWCNNNKIKSYKNYWGHRRIPCSEAERLKSENKYLVDKKYIENFLEDLFLKGKLKVSIILMLIAYAGFNEIEILDIKTENINIDKKVIIIEDSKEIYILPPIIEPLIQYLEEIPSNQKYLFVNKFGKKYVKHNIKDLLRGNCKDPNITLLVLKKFYRAKFQL
jgi:integrase/recombinase XerD